jgi:hypothetical protein
MTLVLNVIRARKWKKNERDHANLMLYADRCYADATSLPASMVERSKAEIMYEIILNPPGLTEPQYIEFYKTLLSVSGVLFGLAFGGMLFILQSGFTTFTFSRKMFLKVYLHFGRQILFALAFLTTLPFFILFFPTIGNTQAISVIYFLFLCLFLNATLDHAKEQGYIITLFSKKFVPKNYGRIRTYFRYINNRGFIVNLLFLYSVIFVLIYPYIISYTETQSFWLTKKSLFYSCMLILGYCLLKITKFIPEFFNYTEIEIEAQSQPSELSEDQKTKNLKEKQHLKLFLLDRGIQELDPLNEIDFIDGQLSINFLESNDNSEAWFNISIDVNNATPEAIRKETFQYACNLLSLINDSLTDINSFVLSFHIRIAKSNTRNIFIRTNRNELKSIFVPGINCVDQIPKLKNVLIDELLR